MAVFGSGGGDDRLQVGLAVWGIVISIVVSIMLPIIFPVSATGYELEDIYAERSSLEMYTGESMINQAPFKLQHVYTPYTVGEEYHFTEEGWLYGTELVDGEGNPSYVIDGVQQIGLTSGIRLDPSHKSNVPLSQSQSYDVELVKYRTLDFLGGGFWQGLAEDVLSFVGFLQPVKVGDDVMLNYYAWDTVTYQAWNFSGYRYELDPMLRINTENGTSTKAVDDAKLSIVWYDLDGQEGISGGLVLYNDKTNGILASYTAAEIVASYDAYNDNASRFNLNFGGTIVSMWIKFDPDVVINNLDLSQSFSMGKWTVAFTTSSADTFLDLQNSNSFTSSLGSMLQTYKDIMTMDIPDVGPAWNLVLWVVCIMPIGLAVILFLSRFGMAGIGAGILGAIFAGGLLG